MNSPSRDAFADYLPVVGRVLIAPLFIAAGAAKFGDIGGTASYMQAHGMPLAAFTALATPIFHGYWMEADPMTAYQQSLHFWKNTALIGGLLFAAAHGPGRLAFDAPR